MSLSLTTTIYRRVEVPVTRYVVSRYRVVSQYVTRLDVDYYDDAGALWTRVSYPTKYLKGVYTEFLGIVERVGEAKRAFATPESVPIRGGALVEGAMPEEKVGVRVAG